MNLQEFTEQVAEYQDRLLKIATENNFAILLMTTVWVDWTGWSNTVWATNMDGVGIARSNLHQSAYAHNLYNNTL